MHEHDALGSDAPVHPMSDRLVIGLDSSTQGTKAIAWDRTGRAVAEGRAAIAMSSPRLDWYEQEPEHWWQAAAEALSACVAQVDADRIDGLAISNQRETLGFFDADGQSVRPAILWLDGRARAQVSAFSERFGAERIHAITGRPPDLTPCLYTWPWLAENEPKAFQRTAMFADVQAVLVQRLCGGPWRTGRMSADPMGIVDMRSMRWSAELLEAIGIDETRLPSLHAPGERLGVLTETSAKATGLMGGMPVFAAGGDGQLAGLGTDCTRPDRAYVNLGTAVVSGIWSREYQYDTAWRTELAGQGGYILETCLRSGAFLVDWFVDQFVAHGRADDDTFSELERRAAALPIGSEGLLLQPYFSGAMDPHWDIDARGVLLGLSGGHDAAHIYRAIIEGITLDLVASIDDLERASGQRVDHFVAIGGGARSRLWRQMLADASGRPVHISQTVEASALGAGMLAAFGAGWYDSVEAAAGAMASATEAVEPDRQRHARYAELLAMHRDLYAATRDLNHRMVAFAAANRE